MNEITALQQIPLLIKGDLHEDDRGSLEFVNDAGLCGVKRFYVVSNKSINVIRAWQAHKMEGKYFFAVNGSFLIAVVKLDDWENPSVHLNAERFILTAGEPQVLWVPPGYANGIRALTEPNKLMVFSTSSLNESIADTYRFPNSLWFDWSAL